VCPARSPQSSFSAFDSLHNIPPRGYHYSVLSPEQVSRPQKTVLSKIEESGGPAPHLTAHVRQTPRRNLILFVCVLSDHGELPACMSLSEIQQCKFHFLAIHQGYRHQITIAYCTSCRRKLKQCSMWDKFRKDSST
jgi:hypothetical protein